jgi:hypothetical protein
VAGAAIAETHHFVIALHKSLNVEIPESDYPKLATLDGAAAYLLQKVNG